MFFDPQPWPVYIAREGERIDFAGVMELKSDMEMDRHSVEIQGMDHEEITGLDLLLPIITKYYGMDTKGLH